MDIKGKEIQFKVRNKETGEEGWLNADEFVETIFSIHSKEVMIPIIEEILKSKEEKDK